MDRRSSASISLVPSHSQHPPRGGKDRRATERVQIEVEFEERTGKSRYFRITEDLTPFGLSTRQGVQHPAGTRMELALYLPDDCMRPVLVQAEVIGRLNSSGGMRLAFRRPSAEAIQRIQRFLQEQLAR